jgi:hypothetical protein
MTAGDGFKVLHRKLAAEKRISSVLDDPSYLQGILGGTRFWNGASWTAEPAANASGGVGPSAR